MRVKNQESRIKNQEPRIKNQESRAKNQEPRIKNQESRAKNQELYIVKTDRPTTLIDHIINKKGHYDILILQSGSHFQVKKYF